jgi:hypothetical protein
MLINKKLIMLICILSAGCSITNPEQIRLDEDNNDIKTFYTDTLTIETSVVQMDPVYTNSPSSLLFGRYDDKESGKVSSMFYTQLAVAGAGLTDESVYDSTVLHLVASYKYGNYDIPQTIEVRELNEGILNRKYYQNYESAVKPDVLNEQSIFLAPADSGRISIRMKDELGERFFRMIKGSSTTFTSQEKFNSYFNGLAIMPGEESNAVVGINPKASKTSLTIYYHTEESKTVQTINFGLSGVRQYNHIEQDLSGTLLSGLAQQKEISSDLLGNKIYIVTGSSIVTKLKIPYLDKFLDEKGPIAVNKAEIIVENLRDYSSSTPPPTNLMLLETNDKNEITYYVDEDEDPSADTDDDRDSTIRAVQANAPVYTFSYGNNLVISYSEDRNNYSASITQYVQALIDKKKSNTGLLLYPLGSGDIVGSLISGDNKYPGKSLKLKLHYTLLTP